MQPRLGRIRTRPSLARRWKASRTGMRLMASSRAIVSGIKPLAGLIAPAADVVENGAVGLVLRRRGCSLGGEAHPIAHWPRPPISIPQARCNSGYTHTIEGRRNAQGCFKGAASFPLFGGVLQLRASVVNFPARSRSACGRAEAGSGRRDKAHAPARDRSRSRAADEPAGPRADPRPRRARSSGQSRRRAMPIA
jgi:hypothetical protein